MAEEVQNPLPKSAQERYTSLELLGCGGKGQVYIAEDKKLGRTVALKVINPELAQDRRERHRFKREILAIANLKHPNIVQLYDFSDSDGVMFYTMELLEGRPFQDVIQTDDLTVMEAVEMVRQVAMGVAAIHKTGVFHRDLKPGNVVVTNDGGIKVIDFGAVKDAVDGNITAITMRGHVVGTVLYQPPEAFSSSEYSAASDVYQLGLILYEALTGCHPLENFLISDIISGEAHSSISPPSSMCAGLDPALEQLVMRCLAARQEERPKDGQEFLDDLSHWRDSRYVQEEEDEVSFETTFDESQRAALLGRRRKRGMKNKLLAASLFLAIVLSGLGAYHLIRTLRHQHFAGTTSAVQPTSPVQKNVPDRAKIKELSTYFKSGDREALKKTLSTMPDNECIIGRIALAILKRDASMALLWGKRWTDKEIELSYRQDSINKLSLYALAQKAPRRLSDEDFGKTFLAIVKLSAPVGKRLEVAEEALFAYLAPFHLHDEPRRKIFANPPKGDLSKGVHAASNYHRFFAAADAVINHFVLNKGEQEKVFPLLKRLQRMTFLAWNGEEYQRRVIASFERWRQSQNAGRVLRDELGVLQMLTLPSPLARPFSFSGEEKDKSSDVMLSALLSFTKAYRASNDEKSDHETVARRFSRAVRLFRRYSREQPTGRFVHEANLFLGRSLAHLACAIDEKTYIRMRRAHIRQPMVIDSGPILNTALAVFAKLAKECCDENISRLAMFYGAYWQLRTKEKATLGYRDFQALSDLERERPLLRRYLTLPIATFTTTPP